MIAQFTSTLSAKGINIDHMSNKSKGDFSYCIIDTDKAIDGETLAKICALDGVLKARTL
jgi:D-3-phosphoglycerate dehydrogenase